MRRALPLLKTHCPLCHSEKNFNVIYKANFSMHGLSAIFSARRLPDRVHYQLVKCTKDGMVRSNPILDTKTLTKLYTNSTFTYEHEVPLLVKTYRQALQPILSSLRPSDHILEIGCGSGFMLSELKKLGFKNLHGVEPSTDAVAHADRALRKKIIAKPFRASLFQPHSMNCIFFLQTLDHISDPNHFLAECKKLLKPGGFILSFHHNVESFSARLLGEHSPIIDIEHTHLYSPHTTRQLFEQAGFIIKNIYSPKNVLSLSHFLWLLPLPKEWKKMINKNDSPLLRIPLHIALGNICIIAQTPAK